MVHLHKTIRHWQRSQHRKRTINGRNVSWVQEKSTGKKLKNICCKTYFKIAIHRNDNKKFTTNIRVGLFEKNRDISPNCKSKSTIKHWEDWLISSHSISKFFSLKSIFLLLPSFQENNTRFVNHHTNWGVRQVLNLGKSLEKVLYNVD